MYKYNKDPYDFTNNITTQGLYDVWSEQHFKTLKSDSAQRAIKSAWNYCSSIYNKKIFEVKPKDLRTCIRDGKYTVHGVDREISPNMQLRAIQVLSMMYDYAVEYELTDKNYPRMMKISPGVRDKTREEKKDHIAFTDEELNVLWGSVGIVSCVDMVSIQTYSGWRPHDPRKTFITLAKKYKVDEYAIKYMVGHAITDVTEQTYAERSFEWLQDEIEKIR